MRRTLSSWPRAASSSTRARCQTTRLRARRPRCAAGPPWSGSRRHGPRRRPVPGCARVRPAATMGWRRRPRLAGAEVSVQAVRLGGQLHRHRLGRHDAGRLRCARAASCRARQRLCARLPRHGRFKGCLRRVGGSCARWAQQGLRALRSARPRQRSGSARVRWRGRRVATARQPAILLRCIRCSSVENNPREIGEAATLRDSGSDRASNSATDRTTGARTQARTGFRRRRDPPRRSGEGSH